MLEKPISYFSGLPASFRAYLKPYIGQLPGTIVRKIITDPAGLVALWETALSCRQRHPDHQEGIAVWTVSVGATSPLVNDNDLFEAIHAEFGSLEFADSYPGKGDAQWLALEQLVAEARERIETDR